MALRRIPAPDLFKVTVRQPLQDIAPKGHLYISFRAGMMRKVEGKLTADKRKGQVAITKDDSGAPCVSASCTENATNSHAHVHDMCMCIYVRNAHEPILLLLQCCCDVHQLDRAGTSATSN